MKYIDFSFLSRWKEKHRFDFFYSPARAAMVDGEVGVASFKVKVTALFYPPAATQSHSDRIEGCCEKHTKNNP